MDEVREYTTAGDGSTIPEMENVSEKTTKATGCNPFAKGSESFVEPETASSSSVDKADLDEILIYHARVGDVDGIRDILAGKREGTHVMDVNHLGTVKWNRGCSALQVAAYFGHLEAVKALLLDPDTDINLRNNHSETALHKAALTNRTEIVQLLLSYAPDVFAKDDCNHKASEVATAEPVRRMIKDMETKQRDNQAYLLFQICREGNVEQLRSLLNGPHPPPVTLMDADGNSALHYAVRHDQKEIATLLIQHGSDPYFKNYHGRSCFDFVVSDPMQKILEIKPPAKFIPTCESLEGRLLKCYRVWNIWRTNYIYLHRGTISFYRTKRDVGNESHRKSYKHLDGAEVRRSHRAIEFSVKFSDGVTFHLRLPKHTDPTERDKWVQQINDHIAYSNHYMGVSDAAVSKHVASVQTIEKFFTDARTNLDELKNALARLRIDTSRHSLRRPSSPSTDVTALAEQCYTTLQLCLDTLREQERQRDKQLAEERERCRVLENALQVLATEHEAVLHSVEYANSTGSLSRAGSVYFSPPESVADADDDVHSLDDNQSMLSAEEDFQEAEDNDTASVSTVPMDSADRDQNGTVRHLNGNGTFGDYDRVLKSKFGWRTSLPVAQFSRSDFSIWSVLKQCIGKDLSKITMPVVFNEPLSFLQRMSEYMEYAHLLDQAAQCTDPVDRILYVAAFAVSSCASNADRIGKPFNPLLGETFELSRPELGYRMVSEQVSHHPPVSAFDAHTDTWKFFGSILPKLKFWGKSVEIQPKGIVTVELKKFKEVYTWSNVNLQVNNIIVGKLWIEQYGTMEITNHTTGLSAVLTFQPTGWMNKELHKVNGYVVDRSKSHVRAIYGKWTEYLRSCDVENFERFMRSPVKKRPSLTGNPGRRPSHDSGTEQNDHTGNSPSDQSPTGGEPPLDIPGSKTLWQLDPRPPHCAKYYGFSLFAMGLNELEEDIKLAPTDSRYRPDIRLLENGDLDRASFEKNRLEEKQRASRKNHKRSQDDWTPTWFTFRKNPATGVEDWMSTEKYWERDYSVSPKIY